MYDRVVKTVTITIPEELDAAAAAEAKRLGTSKSELIRRGLDAVLSTGAEVPEGGDPWHELAGFGNPSVSAESGDIDRVVYGA